MPATDFGRDEDLIDYHSSYREMEAIAFGDFQFHAMSHRAGVLGMDRPLPAVAKYALQYLFVQAEFGLMCPISVTDTSIHLIRKFASAELQAYLLPEMLSGDIATMWKGTQFMTERAGGSDVGAIETTARHDDGVGGCTATNGSARTPTPTWRCCWRGRRARPPAPRASRCSRCRAASRTAAATPTASSGSRTSSARARWRPARSCSRAPRRIWSARPTGASSR